MAVKVKVNLNLNQLFKDITRGVARSRALKDTIDDEIIASIESGVSPVKGKGAYKQYARSTAKKKGRRLPVNLRESGRLHKSLKIRGGRDGLKISFNTDYAGFVDEERRLLPTKRGEKFKTSIQKNIVKRMQRIVDVAVAKSNK